MRSLIIIVLSFFTISAHGVADILDTPDFAKDFTWQDEVVSSTAAIPATTLTSEISLYTKTPANTALTERIVVSEVALFGIVVVRSVVSAFNFLCGMFGLGHSTYGVTKDCWTQFNTRECILSSISLVLAAFGVKWFRTHGLKRVRSDGLEGHGVYEDPDEPLRTVEYHIPVEKRSLKLSSAETENNGTWARHATFFWDGEESHYLMYRRASPDDLGFENDGSIHHFRVQDSDEAKKQRKQIQNGHSALGKRLQKRSYGVVSDYLWRNGNQEAWNIWHNEADFKDMSRKVTNYMESNGEGVSCLTPILHFQTKGGETYAKVDNGIIAYGFNDESYNFHGMAGAWVDACKGSNYK